VMNSSYLQRLCRTTALCVAPAVLLTSQAALAQGLGMDAGRPAYTKADWAMLPAWCVDTQDNAGSPNWGAYKLGRNASPLSDHWTSIFGTDFWHMHHYCRGLFHLRRLESTVLNPMQKLGAIERVIDELGYIVKNCKETNPLMPEIFYRLGEMELLRNNPTRALDAFARSRALKPDYWPAYTRWADELIRLRLYKDALNIVEAGLVHLPEHIELEKRKKLIEQHSKSPKNAPILVIKPAS
jgi:hypothetical protein